MGIDKIKIILEIFNNMVNPSPSDALEMIMGTPITKPPKNSIINITNMVANRYAKKSLADDLKKSPVIYRLLFARRESNRPPVRNMFIKKSVKISRRTPEANDERAEIRPGPRSAQKLILNPSFII
jgi:hypothetical protein